MRSIFFLFACLFTLATASGQIINDTLIYFKGEPGRTLLVSDFKAVSGLRLPSQEAMRLQKAAGGALKISPDTQGFVTLRPGNGYRMYYAAKGNRWIVAPNQQAATLMSNAELNRITQLKSGLRSANYLALIQYPDLGKNNTVKCDVHPFSQRQ
ncbi:MAG: hypothetical protein H6555_03845 [Lewinellaceae bacterium]|nr:hypothetical protein [Lewinellaceae bacterium]